MVSDTGLIVVSVISLAGMVLLFTLNNNNWFRRENFKLQKSNILNENKIKMKKLERDLGISSSKTPNVSPQGGVLDLIKGLDSNKIGEILNVLKNDDDIEEEPKEEGILGLIDKLPPEVIQGAIEKLGLLKNDDQDQAHYLS